MPTNTTNMALPKPIDSDNAESALASSIPTAFDKLDVHRHTGGADGLTIPASGLAAGAATGAALGSDVVTLTGAQTLTNKTLTIPQFGQFQNGVGLWSVPAVSDTIVGKATTDTLTNKTITSPTISGHIHASGTTPAIANGAGLGGGGSTTIQGNDIRGFISLLVGTAPGTLMATVTFASPFTSAPCVVVSLNGNSPGGVSLMTANVTTTTFQILFTGAPTASTTYQVYYQTIDMG